MNGEEDGGIYQIYGNHLVFGQKSLLYIGMVNGGNSTFGARFDAHQKRWLLEDQAEVDIFIHVGRLMKGDYQGQPGWATLVEEIEKLLIYYHSPPYNSHHINSYNSIPMLDSNLHVQNLGKCGVLVFELTNLHLKIRPQR